MFYRLKLEARRLRVYLSRERQRGYTLTRTLLLRLPQAFTGKLYRKTARIINGFILREYFNAPRFRSFQRRRDAYRNPCFYVIVMPDVLHFLVPCLRLIPKHVDVVLLHNGARSWEREYLHTNFPEFPAFTMWTLPWSSLPHGDMLTLLLRNHEESFGILDHDTYVFNHLVFEHLVPESDSYAIGLFKGRSAHTGIDYPHTYFLVLNTPRLREIMDRYRVDARIYRKLPMRLQPIFDQLGLTSGIHLKVYHNYFDTLHVIFALAHAEGLRARFLSLADADSVYHVGGTSIGDHRTRDLAEQYIQLRFLERIDDPTLRRRYDHLRKEFTSADEIRRRLTLTPERFNSLALSELMRRLDTSESTKTPLAAKGQ